MREFVITSLFAATCIMAVAAFAGFTLLATGGLPL
jgi:hypothetical protein